MPNLNMNPKDVLITNDFATYSMADISIVELIIIVSSDGESFWISKNRHGIAINIPLPISLLPKVIANPSGTLTFDWK